MFSVLLEAVCHAKSYTLRCPGGGRAAGRGGPGAGSGASGAAAARFHLPGGLGGILAGLFEQMEWAEGEAERTFWGLFVNLEDKKRRKVVTYACTGCGFLESYAVLDPTHPGA